MRDITKSKAADPSRDLLFALLALQNGLIEQGATPTSGSEKITWEVGSPSQAIEAYRQAQAI